MQSSESDLQPLDKYVANGEGDGVVWAGDMLHVAGYDAAVGLAICGPEGGAKGLALFVVVGIDMPGKRLMPSKDAIVVCSWTVTTRTAELQTMWQYVDAMQTSDCVGRYLIMQVASGDGQDAPVTKALRDAGFIKDGIMELGVQVTCTT